jgi:hypothetical protein
MVVFANMSNSEHIPATAVYIRYRWQQSVLDAFLALPESLPAKINAAERAISARLMERVEPDVEEKLALHDALRALRVLIGEAPAKTVRQQKLKKYIA